MPVCYDDSLSFLSLDVLIFVASWSLLLDRFKLVEDQVLDLRSSLSFRRYVLLTDLDRLLVTSRYLGSKLRLRLLRTTLLDKQCFVRFRRLLMAVLGLPYQSFFNLSRFLLGFFMIENLSLSLFPTSSLLVRLDNWQDSVLTLF